MKLAITETLRILSPDKIWKAVAEIYTDLSLEEYIPYEHVEFVQTRRLVVSARVRKAFLENKIRVMEFEPVLIL